MLSTGYLRQAAHGFNPILSTWPQPLTKVTVPEKMPTTDWRKGPNPFKKVVISYTLVFLWIQKQSLSQKNYKIKKSTRGVFRVHVLYQTRKVIFFYRYPPNISSLTQSAAQPAPFYPRGSQSQMTEAVNLQVDLNLFLASSRDVAFQCTYISSF